MLIVPSLAFADLGDTYSASCKKYGGKGTPFTDSVVWKTRNGIVMEWFHNNQCVCVVYSPFLGTNYPEGEVWRSLQANSKPGAKWIRNPNDKDGNCEYQTEDGTIYGKWSYNGKYFSVRVAYASFLHRHGLLTSDMPTDDTLPPVEESKPII